MNARLTNDRSQRGGLLGKLLLFLGGLLVAAVLLWVLFLPRMIVSAVRSRTGFAVKVDQLSVSPFTGNAAITGLVLQNPEGWPLADFVDLREFRADVKLFSFFGTRYVANEVTVDVAQVTLVKNRQGTMNAMAFRDALTAKAAGGKQPTPGKTAAKQEFLIKHLVLKFDKLVYADYSGGQPKTKEYRLGINQDMRDVDSVTKLVSPFTGSALGLVSGALTGVFPASPDLLKSLKGTLQDAGTKTGEKIKGLLDSLDKMKP